MAKRTSLYGGTMSLENRDPTFWDVRVIERRLRRGELTIKELTAHLEKLPECSSKYVQSVPLEEPLERPIFRRPMIRVTAAPMVDGEFDSDDLDDDFDDDEDDDDDL